MTGSICERRSDSGPVLMKAAGAGYLLAMSFILALLVLTLFGCGSSAESAPAGVAECVEAQLEMPPDVTAIWELSYDAGKGVLYALTDAASAFDPYGGMDVAAAEAAHTIVWESDDQGVTWHAGVVLPEGLRRFGAFNGAFDDQGGCLVVLGTYTAQTPEDMVIELCYFDREGGCRELGGVAGITLDGIIDVEFLSDEEAVLSCFNNSPSGGHLCHAYLYDIGQQVVTADIPCGEDVGAIVDCVALGEDGLLVCGTDGWACYSAHDGSRTVPAPGLEDFMGRFWSDRLSGMHFCSDAGRIYAVARQGIFAYDPESPRAEVVAAFGPAVMDGGSGCPIAFSRAADGFMLSYTTINEPILCSLSVENGPSQGDALEVYMLTANGFASQVIGEYQRQHPDFKCRITVGMDGEGAATEEDAVRALNARMLAGDGPDLIFLDGLPVESYIEKGLLEDMGDLVPAGECFGSVVDTYATDEEVCALPLQFVLYGMLDCGSSPECADASAAGAYLAERAEEGGIYGSYYRLDDGLPDKYGIYAGFLYDLYSPSLVEGGAADVAALEEYFGYAGRMHVAFEEEGDTLQLELLRSDSVEYGASDVILGRSECCVGVIDSVISASFLFQAVRDDRDNRWVPALTGCAMYCPASTVGISAGSEFSDEARELVGYLLSEDVQAPIRMAEGQLALPVNRAAFKRALSGEDVAEGGILFTLARDSTGSGARDVECLGEEEIAQLVDLAESIVLPVAPDAVIRETVMGNLQKYLDGDLTLDEAVAASKQKIDLYLAE